jgi:dipeptide transport system substrate-binding protein
VSQSIANTDFELFITFNRRRPNLMKFFLPAIATISLIASLTGCVENSPEHVSKCNIQMNQEISSELLVSPSCRVFTSCSAANPEGFDPAFYTYGETFNASSTPLFNRLVEYVPGTTNLMPGLAESWSISENGLIYSFTLRQNVEFHSRADFQPSRALNADDVLFSLNRQIDANHPYHDVGGYSYPYAAYLGIDSLIVSIQAVNATTVDITLSEPNAEFLSLLAMEFASIHSAEYASEMLTLGTREQIDTAPIGTGPFKLVQYKPGQLVTFVPHENYWHTKADIDLLQFNITPDADDRFSMVKNGTCQHMAYPTASIITETSESESLKLISQVGFNIGYLAFNTNVVPFNDARVRRALNHATNRSAILNEVYGDFGQLATNPIPPSLWSSNDTIDDFEYNPELARQLLNEAGYPDGFNTNIWTMPVERPYNPDAVTMATMIQSDWAAVGVSAQVISYQDWGEYLERTRNGEHETMMLGWTGDNADPSNFLDVLLSCSAALTGSNRAFWCNTAFDNELQAALNTTDQLLRTQHYKEAQQIFHDEAPWMPLAHSTNFEILSSEVSGYRMGPLGHQDFKSVQLAE